MTRLRSWFKGGRRRRLFRRRTAGIGVGTAILEQEGDILLDQTGARITEQG